MHSKACGERSEDFCPAGRDKSNGIFKAGAREGAVTASHSLKGVCGNLSMTELFDLLTRQVGLLRAEDWAGAMDLMPGIDGAYEETCRAIRESFG